MNRTQRLLGVALLVQVVLILALRSPFSASTSGTQARPLLPVLEAITPAKVEIQGSADEKKITLERQDGAWHLDEAGGFPADESKVEELIDNLKEITVRRPVVSSSRYHDTFKVAEGEHEGRIRVWADDDDPDVDLYLGTSPNYRVTHVRASGEDAVYEARGLASYDVRPDTSAWIDNKLIKVDAEDVTYFALTNASGTFELEKQDGVWRPVSGEESRGLDSGKVDSLLRTATSLRLTDAAGQLDEAAQGFAEPAATVELRWSSDDTSEALTLRVGGAPKGEDSKRYVSRSGFQFAGTIWESSVNRLLEGKLDELYAGADVSG